MHLAFYTIHVQFEPYLFRFAPINSNIPIPIHDELSIIYIFDEADRLILFYSLLTRAVRVSRDGNVTNNRIE